MKLVLDSNIIFSALIKKSITRDIILSDLFELYAPEYIFNEITKHKELLLRKSKLDKGDFDALLLLLQKHIHLITKDKYYEKMAMAEDILGNIDITDSPFLALPWLWIAQYGAMMDILNSKLRWKFIQPKT